MLFAEQTTKRKESNIKKRRKLLKKITGYLHIFWENQTQHH